MITVRDLKHFQLLKKEIIKQQKRIDRLRETSRIGDRVAGSNNAFPYEERHFQIIAPTNQATIRQAERELERLLMLQREILELFNDTHGADRKILMLTMKGLSQTEIAKRLNVDQSTISRKLRKLCI